MSEFDGKALARLCKRHGLDAEAEDFSFVDVLEAVCLDLDRMAGLLGAMMQPKDDEKIVVVPAGEMPKGRVM